VELVAAFLGTMAGLFIDPIALIFIAACAALSFKGKPLRLVLALAIVPAALLIGLAYSNGHTPRIGTFALSALAAYCVMAGIGYGLGKLKRPVTE